MAAIVAVLSIGGVAAAATGRLPGQVEPVAEQAPPTTAAARGLGKAAVADLDNATQGLCRAWQAGKGSDNGSRADAPAFQALATAAGGADNIAGYCADVTAGSASDHGQGQASPPSASRPTTPVSPPSSGPPPGADPGGHGQGGPPTTTG